MTDTKKMNINEAFCAAQSEIGVARKNTSNPFFNSKYADLKECFNACSDALNEHGIHISQPTMLEGDLFVIRTILTHTSGETMQDFGVPIVGWREAKNPAQAFGSGQTYARRYGLCGMVGIAPSESRRSPNCLNRNTLKQRTLLRRNKMWALNNGTAHRRMVRCSPWKGHCIQSLGCGGQDQVRIWRKPCNVHEPVTC